MRAWGPALALGLIGSSIAAAKWVRSSEGVPSATASAERVTDSAKVEMAPTEIPLMVRSGSGARDVPDLSKIGYDEKGAFAPATSGQPLRLTIDPELQQFTQKLLALYRLPEAAIVLTEVKTGRVLVYASRAEGSTARRDLCREATAPSASVFKVVTAAALVEKAGLLPSTIECYPGGGEQKILPVHLKVDPARDRYCTSLAQAMGKSTNPVFARLALRHLAPAVLEQKAHDLGYGESIPFDLPVERSSIRNPGDDLSFARTAAGFWNTTLSPVHAAWLSSTIANGGVSPDLHIVDRTDQAENQRRILTEEQSSLLTEMLEHTVTEGTSRRAFHDGRGTPFLPNIRVAGKTGTLADREKDRLYTWFTGFAPTKPTEGMARVAIAVLVVNRPAWKVKANVVARDVLRAYFAKEHVPEVTVPRLERIARRSKK